MLIIGELINGMYRQVGQAIANRDKTVIQKLAQDQVNAGANFLDINTGPLSKDPLEDMKWLVETVQSATEVGLCLDSTKAECIEQGLKISKRKTIINSTNAQPEKLGLFIELALKYNASLIGLTTDEKGVPRDKNQRLDLALRIIDACTQRGLALDELYIDPVVLPVNVAQPQGLEVLEAIKEIKLLASPPIKVIVGLSNISQGTAKNRRLINRTFLIMAVSSGLDAAILDPLDNALMDLLITAELLLNRHIYCDSFLEAYRKKDTVNLK
jgi:5-methyltetrahydrofolate corrinoid/iron sulfur protein methyltransferase